MATYQRQVQWLRMSGAPAFISPYLLMTCVGPTLMFFAARIYIYTYLISVSIKLPETKRAALFWVITQRVVVHVLPTFRDNLSVPSSGAKTPEITIPEMMCWRWLSRSSESQIIFWQNGADIYSPYIWCSIRWLGLMCAGIWESWVCDVMRFFLQKIQRRFLKGSVKTISYGALNCQTRQNIRNLLPCQIIVNKIGQSWPLACACALASVIGSNLYKK